MTAIELLQAAAQVTWVILGVIQVARAVRRPTRTNVDIALFFGALAFVTIEGRAVAIFDVPFEDQVRAFTLFIVMTIPYSLVRVIRDFGGAPARVMRAAEVGLGVSFAVLVLFGTQVLAGTLFLVAYFAALSIYSAVRSVGLAVETHGVTRQRMRAVAAGSYFLGIAILIAGVGIAAPAFVGVTGGLQQLVVLASALSYFVGFTPPGELRKYWQIPEFRAFVARSAALPRSSLAEIADDVAAAAARTLGARAAVGLWDESAGMLRFRETLAGLPNDVGPSRLISWRTFESQRAVYVPDAVAAVPEHAREYSAAGVGPMLAAPITAGDRRLGVLVVYARRQPIFAEDDLDIVQLIAGQAAVLVEARLLIDDAARVRAVEETARLKEDFVSAAAHDLKTPLTTIVAQAQLLERRAERDGRTADLPGLQRLVREAAQLARLVEELLDASRLERGALPMHPEPVDLQAIVREVATRERPGRERIDLEVDGPLRGELDRERIAQLVDNLIENALKYSPAESRVSVRATAEDGTARIAVTDQGIGIPSEDLPHVFERFRRGSNVDHRRFSGIGLGLFICRGIAEQHGGRIWVDSSPGRSTTFHVALPLAGVQTVAAS